MTHHHKPLTRKTASSLGTCRRVELAWCQCGASLPNSTRWIEPKALEPCGEYTIADAAHYLKVHINT